MIEFTDMDAAGLLPAFFNEHDPRPAAVQLDEAYQHGGGWRPLGRWTISYNEKLMEYVLKSVDYTEDGEMPLISQATLHDEKLMLFEGAFLAIVQLDGSFEVARVD